MTTIVTWLRPRGRTCWPGLQHGAATSYGKPGPAQAGQIAGLLAASRPSQHQRREIAFGAGIRVPPAGS